MSIVFYQSVLLQYELNAWNTYTCIFVLHLTCPPINIFRRKLNDETREMFSLWFAFYLGDFKREPFISLPCGKERWNSRHAILVSTSAVSHTCEVKGSGGRGRKWRDKDLRKGRDKQRKNLDTWVHQTYYTVAPPLSMRSMLHEPQCLKPHWYQTLYIPYVCFSCTHRFF